MKAKIQLPESFLKIFEGMEGIFTKPSFPYFIEYIKGLLISGKYKHVTKIYLLGDRLKHFTNYHRFLNRNKWDGMKLGLVLLKKLLSIFKPKELAFGLDDTLVRKFGPNIFGRGVHFDHSARGNLAQFMKGHSWVVCGLLHRLSIFRKWLCFPFMSELYIPEKVIKKEDKFRTKLDIASDIVHRIMDAVQTPFIVVTDAFYGKAKFIKACIDCHATLISRIRYDSALYRPLNQSKQKRGRGRPRKYGRRLPCLETLAKQRDKFKEVKLELYGKEKAVAYREFTVLWKPAGCMVKVLIVLYRNHKRDFTSYFFSTDLNMPAEKIITYVAARWSLENAFKDMKEHLGLNSWQCRKKEAVLRSIPLTCIAYSSLLLWSQMELDKEQIPIWAPFPWQTDKEHVSLADIMQQLKNWCVTESVLSELGDIRINGKKRERIKAVLRLAA
jgi:SRSO17 transposase